MWRASTITNSPAEAPGGGFVPSRRTRKAVSGGAILAKGASGRVIPGSTSTVSNRQKPNSQASPDAVAPRRRTISTPRTSGCSTAFPDPDRKDLSHDRKSPRDPLVHALPGADRARHRLSGVGRPSRKPDAEERLAQRTTRRDSPLPVGGLPQDCEAPALPPPSLPPPPTLAKNPQQLEASSPPSDGDA